MPRKIFATSHRIPVSQLDPTTFAPFGEVIQNPSTHNGQPALETVQANQGTATKWLNVTRMEHDYDTLSKGRRNAKCSMNMFVCRPRKLKVGRVFEVGIVERHPHTPQTFVPLGLGREDRETAYLVIVAPTLPCRSWNDVLPPGSTALEEHQRELMMLKAHHDEHSRAAGTGKNCGPPDMANLKAFVARGDQAVTYAAGTWHAPMVVLGEGEIAFVVVQYMNGVVEDDVEEVEIAVRDGGDGVEVDIGAGELLGIQGESPKL